MRQMRRDEKEEAIIHRIADALDGSTAGAPLRPSDLDGVSLKSMLTAQRLIGGRDAVEVRDYLSANPKLEEVVMSRSAAHRLGLDDGTAVERSVEHALLGDGSACEVTDLLGAYATGKIDAKQLKKTINAQVDEIRPQYETERRDYLDSLIAGDDATKKLYDEKASGVKKIAGWTMIGVGILSALGAGGYGFQQQVQRESVEHEVVREIYDDHSVGLESEVDFATFYQELRAQAEGEK